MEIPFTQYLLFIVLYAAASFVQGFVGFAFAVISVPIMSLMVSPGFAVGMNAVLGSFQCTVNFIMLRKTVEYGRTGKYLAASLLFIPPGAIFLATMSKSLIIGTLGGAVILLTLFSAIMNSNLFSRQGTERVLPEKSGYLFSALSGLLGGAFTTPGPPIIAFFYNSGMTKKQARANLQFFFTGISVVIVTTHVISGNLNARVLLYALPVIPFVFIFTKLGLIVSDKVRPALFQVIIQVFLVLLGLFLVYRSLA
jgi:hypothetical protein